MITDLYQKNCPNIEFGNVSPLPIKFWVHLIHYQILDGFGWTQGICDHKPSTGNKAYVTKSESILNYSCVIMVYKYLYVITPTLRNVRFLPKVVTSSPGNVARRDSIRKTWGSDLNKLKPFRIALVFLVGLTRDEKVIFPLLFYPDKLSI